ncbi:MAG: SAM-dependent methyltransferase [Bacteroidales bacterium]|nr:SAM-dependent methyltransferase [Bacteroidales bacterium]
MQLYRSGCLICGDELVYSENHANTCIMCGRKFRSEVKCKNGHFVCDECHSAPAEALIDKMCSASSEQNPLKLAQEIMAYNAIKIHGPEHHFLVAACLLVCYANTTGQIENIKPWVQIAKQRSRKLPGGFCGSHGNCGAAVATGIFVSVMSNATPLSGREWQLSNLMTAKSLYTIAIAGGPRCCKRDTFIAIREAQAFIIEYFEVELPINETIICEYVQMNGQCTLSDCEFFKN